MLAEITLDLFNDNVRNIKLNSIIEKNNFNLVRDYLEGAIIQEEYAYSSGSFDKEFLVENIDQIFNELNNKTYNPEIRKMLNQRLKSLSELFGEYKVYEQLSEKKKLDKSEKKIFREIKSKLFYFIIELRASLGLSLEKIHYEDIFEYCNALTFDVNNGKYKRLDIESHFNDDGTINQFKK